MNVNRMAAAISTLMATFFLNGCGAPAGSDQVSELDWTQSRSGNQRYAYLWQSDIQDEFLFGVNIIKVDDFISNALNATVRPLPVKLKLKSGTGSKLDVVTSNTGESLMSFKLGVLNGKYEIDFESAGNDLSLQSLVQTVGGTYTAENADGYWISEGTPKVLKVLQDNNTVVVDLQYSVSQVILGRTLFGRRYIKERLSEHPGKVVARIYLIRKKSLPALSVAKKTVKQGRDHNLGFFPSDFNATGAQEANLPVQRMMLGDLAPGKVLTYYLKNFPANYVQVAKEAVESWNIALGSRQIKAEIAPEDVDAGDPRYHVVKWIDGTDNDLGWAGVAKMLTNPETGIVMGGSVYIQGDTLLKLYGDLVAFSHKMNAGGLTRIGGQIGSVNFENEQGEAPVIPFATDTTQDFAEYMQEYYRETIAHEVGHVLGLRHNFRGSTLLSASGASASVMDYLPRAKRNKYEGPGTYDVAAIKWAYLGSNPITPQPFCTDEDIYKSYDCSQGDYGDPLQYVANGLIDGAMLLAQKPVAAAGDSYISSMQSVYESALKILHFKSQLSAADRSFAEATLPEAMTYMETAEPFAGLAVADRSIVLENLSKLKDLAGKAKDSMRARGML